ncbi:hypothetical protein EDB19DRAFT_1784330, partial [Suillus lakei]
ILLMSLFCILCRQTPNEFLTPFTSPVARSPHQLEEQNRAFNILTIEYPSLADISKHHCHRPITSTRPSSVAPSQLPRIPRASLRIPGDTLAR